RAGFAGNSVDVVPEGAQQAGVALAADLLPKRDIQADGGVGVADAERERVLRAFDVVAVAHAQWNGATGEYLGASADREVRLGEARDIDEQVSSYDSDLA